MIACTITFADQGLETPHTRLEPGSTIRDVKPSCGPHGPRGAVKCHVGLFNTMEICAADQSRPLGVTLEDPIDVYLWFGEDPGWCSSEHAVGCYQNGEVHADALSVGHELVHAVVDTLGSPAAFWDEGAAEALQSDRTIFGATAPVASLELDTGELGYSTARHFSRWLIETRGIELYRTLLRSPKAAREAFESTYDMSFEDAQEQYYDEAPYSYGALVACNYPALPSVGTHEWFEELDIDCSNENVRGSPLGMGILRVLTIEERGYYEFSTTAEVGVIARCDDEDLGQPVLLGDPEYGDVPPVTANFIHQYSRTFGVDEAATVLELVPGRYEVGVGNSDLTPSNEQLRVRAAPGPIPGTPAASP